MTGTLEERPVGEAMSADVLAVTETESALMAWELMRQGGYHHVPVLSDDGGLIGVLDAETLAAAWDSGGPDRMRKPVGTLVGHRPPAHVRPQDSVATAARAMLAAGTDVVPVLDEDGRLSGLFTAWDLIALAAGAHPRTRAGHVTAPALYRIEPVLPERHPQGSVIPPS
ncbi:CBS domain-containing protein [Actinoallomurus rhizosphaericola]|uniref:CBS domain-containing protein n=1 Tax=Actinoallomurus rhizosphaericola TaxID=2952536 RepID=UPI002092EE95|nr:CBS domain-containing protein [Actinoallomurus rhizosphaericola]MCO5996747.1 CBS domain-containing protein [Actinoallomurus rhizosphaericola]